MTGSSPPARSPSSWGWSPETVLRRYRAGEIPGYRLASNCLRFRESGIEAWLEARRAA